MSHDTVVDRSGFSFCLVLFFVSLICISLVHSNGSWNWWRANPVEGPNDFVLSCTSECGRPDATKQKHTTPFCTHSPPSSHTSPWTHGRVVLRTRFTDSVHSMDVNKSECERLEITLQLINCCYLLTKSVKMQISVNIYVLMIEIVVHCWMWTVLLERVHPGKISFFSLNDYRDFAKRYY